MIKPRLGAVQKGKAGMLRVRSRGAERRKKCPGNVFITGLQDPVSGREEHLTQLHRIPSLLRAR